MVTTIFDISVVYNGITRVLAVQAHEQTQALLARAVAAFGVQQGGHLLSLFTADNSEIGDNSSVETAGIVPNEMLLLRPSRVRGGRA
jgi:hypothetical protein